MLNKFMKKQQTNFQSVGQIFEKLDRLMDNQKNLQIAGQNYGNVHKILNCWTKTEETFTQFTNSPS